MTDRAAELKAVLVVAHGPADVRLLVDRWSRVVRQALEESSGEVLADPEGRMWAVFDSVTLALRAAAAVCERQLLLYHAFEQPPDYRAALHLGDLVRDSGRLSGPAPELAQELLAGCPPACLHLSASVLSHLSARPSHFVLEGSTAHLSPQRCQELLSIPPDSAQPRLLLAWETADLDPDRATAVEREAMRLARGLQGTVLQWRSPSERGLGAGFVVLPPGRRIGPILSALTGIRAAVGFGEILARRDDSTEGAEPVELCGLLTEHVLEVLQESGLEPAVHLLTEDAARSVAGEELCLEPYGPSGGRHQLFLYRVLRDGPPSALAAAHNPRRISTFGSGGWLDLVAGVAPEPGSGPLWESLQSLGAPWSRLSPIVSSNAAGRPEAGLALAAAALASHRGVALEGQVLAVGELRPDGTVWCPPDRGVPATGATLLAPSALAARSPDFVIDRLDQLEAWLTRSRTSGLGHAVASGRLTVVVAGPLGGAAERARLEHALSGAQGSELPALAQELEDEMGRDVLLGVFSRWAAELGEAPLCGWLDGLRGGVVLALFPDPRLEDLSGPAVVPLAGRLAEPGSLRLTEMDHEDLLAHLGPSLASASERIATQPLLLLGDGGTPALLKALYTQLRQQSGELERQTAWVALPDAREADRRWWERRGAEVLAMSSAALAAELAIPARAETPPPSPDRLSTLAQPTRPYKFLNYYGAEDRAIFFGREAEIEQVSRRLLHHPILVLFGKSGVGKTSLLRAGVLSRLGAPRDLTLYARPLGDPAESLRERLAEFLGDRREEGLRETFRRTVERLSGHLTVVLDQFEEFFVHCGRELRERFIHEVARFAVDPPPRCHLVFSLREDFLAEMSEFEERTPTILDNRFRVKLLTTEQARRAIVAPAELFGLRLEEGLVDNLLEQIAEEGVDPPELQIVLDRLYRARAPSGAEGGEITLEIYHRLGGVRPILVNYLESTLQEMEDDLELVRRLLKAMVTERRTKAVISVEALAERLGEPAGKVHSLLGRLVESRLVRSLSEPGTGELPAGAARYELAHEYVIDEVVGWTSESELAVLHARQVLETEMASWKRAGTLMAPDRLAVVKPHQDALRLTSGEQAMLIRAAALHGDELTGWLSSELACSAGIPVLLELLATEAATPEIRRGLLATLFGLHLSDTEAAVLLSAAGAIGNPTVLGRLRAQAAGRERLLEEVALRVVERFFGPGAMVRVPAGPALLGSTRQNKEERKSRMREDLHGRIDTEPELQAVQLAGFWSDRYPVTHAEYAEFRPSHRHYFAPEEARHPVVYVSHAQATDYAAWLGKGLPSEQEWEKAARGTDGRLYPWGSEFDASRLNSAESGRRHTTPVDAHPAGASPYGCLDMSGNVWEWTVSPWAREGPFLAKKGGCAINYEPHMQCSARFEDLPDIILKFVGFRTLVHSNPWERRDVGWFLDR